MTRDGVPREGVIPSLLEMSKCFTMVFGFDGVKKKALSNANPKTLDFASEIRVFYDVFFFVGPTQPARPQPQPEPGHDN